MSKYGNFARWADPRLAARALALQRCAVKARHASAGAAEAHLRSLVRRYGPQTPAIQPYACTASASMRVCWSRPPDVDVESHN